MQGWHPPQPPVFFYWPWLLARLVSGQLVHELTPLVVIGTLLNWVVLPAAALLLGGLPVLQRSDTGPRTA